MEQARLVLDRLRANMRETIRGKDGVIDLVLTGLAAGGHVLLEDLPGVGKTTSAYSLARSMDCTFSRIQFTSDLLPGDVTGVAVYDETMRTFVFKPGPVFAHIVLADEINRATPKTQSALLEVMDRARVSVDGQTHAVGSPFMVFATQNPLDFEGTFPLPESQMDRFLLRLRMGYPDPADEREVLRRARGLRRDRAQPGCEPRGGLGAAGASRGGLRGRHSPRLHAAASGRDACGAGIPPWRECAGRSGPAAGGPSAGAGRGA